MYGIDGRAASKAWLGMGGQGIGVQGGSGSIPHSRGNHHFWWCQFQMRERKRLEREYSEKVLRAPGGVQEQCPGGGRGGEALHAIMLT